MLTSPIRKVATSITRARRPESSIRFAAEKKVAWMGPKKYCSTSTNWPRAKYSWRWLPTLSARTETCSPIPSTLPAFASMYYT